MIILKWSKSPNTGIPGIFGSYQFENICGLNHHFDSVGFTFVSCCTLMLLLLLLTIMHCLRFLIQYLKHENIKLKCTWGVSLQCLDEWNNFQLNIFHLLLRWYDSIFCRGRSDFPLVWPTPVKYLNEFNLQNELV